MRNVAPFLIVLRTFFFFLILVYITATSDNGLLILCFIFSFCVFTAGNLLLIGGIHYRRNNLILAYFFIAALFIICIILQLFTSILDSANTKDTLGLRSLSEKLSVFALLWFEAYTVAIVWRVFVYVCDVRMDSEVKSMARQRRIAERLRHRQSRDSDHMIAIKVGDEAESLPDPLLDKALLPSIV